MTDAKRLLATEFAPTDHGAWQAMVERALGTGAIEAKLVTHTPEGIAVRPLYTAADAPSGLDAELPGLAPYARGTLALGRAGPRRDLRVAVANPDHDAARREIARDLAHGAHSLWLCLDLAARLGRDGPRGAPVDDFEAPGIGCVSAAHLGALTDDVAFEKVPVALDAGANALPAAAVWFAAARARGIAPERLSGTLSMDLFGSLARDGSLPASFDAARLQLIALARWTDAHAPGVRAACVSTLPHHDAGAHAAQEVAYALATGVEYLHCLAQSGLGVDAAAKQIAFRVAVASDVFMEIAKLRALRWLWAEVVQTAGGTEDAARAPVHAVTSARTRTRRDPWVNMARETAQAFAAHVGGADAVTTVGFDALWGMPDAFARRIALNAQLLLDEESHVTRVADPAGGSWYVESLTDALARRAWEHFTGIQREGGIGAALASGRVAREIATVAEARQGRIARHEQTVVGVTEFALPNEEPLARAAVDAAAVERERRRWLEAARGEALGLHKLAGRDGPEVMDAAVAAAGAGVSLAAITAALAGGEAPKTVAALPPRRDASAHDRAAPGAS